MARGGRRRRQEEDEVEEGEVAPEAPSARGVLLEPEPAGEPEPEPDFEAPPVRRLLQEGVDYLLFEYGSFRRQVPVGFCVLANSRNAELAVDYNGQTWALPAGDVAVVPKGAADEACGPDNTGGRLSIQGVRVLVVLDSRYAGLAREARKSLRAFVDEMNRARLTDGVAAAQAFEKALAEAEGV